MVMSEPDQKLETTIDASQLTPDQLLSRLADVPSDARVRLNGLAENVTGILAGLNQSSEIVIASGIGDFALMASQQAAVEISGSAGDGCGHSFHSGSILIRGGANNFLAAYAIGGYIAVHGRAGDYAGYGLAGADVLVRSRSGNAAGAKMRAGTLVLGNGCGENLGIGMTGGTIYVRGEIGSIADNIQIGRLKEADTIRLGLMLVRAGIKTTYEKFQVFRPKSDKAS